MTLPPDPYADTSSAGPTPTAARSTTESMRQIAAVALLAGNAVFLFLGVSTLVFVVSRWFADFGARSEAVFDTFAGPVAVALPLLAMLVATHLSPPLPQSRLILRVALAEYAVSAVFGVITYLGAFAEGVFSVRSTFNGLLGRAVWLAFLTIAIAAVYRVYRAMFPPTPRAAYSYGPTIYGRPYPGQPSYPRPGGYAPTQPTGARPDPHDPPPAPPADAAEPTVRIAEPPTGPPWVAPGPAGSVPEPDTTSLPTLPPPPGASPSASA